MVEADPGLDQQISYEISADGSSSDYHVPTSVTDGYDQESVWDTCLDVLSDI